VGCAAGAGNLGATTSAACQTNDVCFVDNIIAFFRHCKSNLASLVSMGTATNLSLCGLSSALPTVISAQLKPVTRADTANTTAPFLAQLRWRIVEFIGMAPDWGAA
jgi:hypothetical protein